MIVASISMALPRYTLMCYVLLSVIHYGVPQTQVCTTYDIGTSSSNKPSAIMKSTVSMNSGAVLGTGLSTSISHASIDYVSFETTIINVSSLADIVLQRTVQMVDASAIPPLIQLTTTILHDSLSSSPSVDAIVLDEDLSNGLQAYWTSSFVPGYYASGVSITGRTGIGYVPSTSLSQGSNATVQFDAEPSGDEGRNLASGITDFYALVSFNDTTNSVWFKDITLPICLDATYYKESSIFYQHGFTALTFFVAMLVGFLLVVLGVFLFRYCRGRSTVSPMQRDEIRMKEKGKKIVMDPKAALQKGLNVIKDYSIIAWNHSIILILALKDKLLMFREIDNLDILATIHVDTDLEQEQNDAATETCFLLIQGLQHNGDISRQTEEAAINNFNKNLKELVKKLDAEYKKELEGVYTDLSAKNKEKLAELLQKHRQQKQEAIAATRELSDKERESLLQLIDKQHQMEDNELTFNLALEQSEEAEKLRKEYAIRKRMGIKELQQNMLSEVIGQGKLHMEQADWLLKEHKKQQEAVHRMYDEEISRQRMVLEEKLAKRRALAQASENQEDDISDLLNLQATHTFAYVHKAQKNNLITEEQTEELIDDIKDRVLAVKTKMETTKETQEKELHKELSQAKVSQLSDMIKTHNSETEKYIKENKVQQTEGPVDPVSYAEGLLKLKSQHRLELANLENQLDGEHAQQLDTMRQEVAQTAQSEMTQVQRDIIHTMRAEGMTEKVVAALMKKHEAEVETLKNTQEKNRRNQEDKLKEELARRRRQWAERRERERREQGELREHEAEVVEKLVNSQLSLSEAERDRIMKEHEKQMVLLENSLTLNKLRQQHALEERLQQKRAQQMRKLQSQQKAEVTKQYKLAQHNGEEDDEDNYRARLDLMKKHAQQRIAVMQGQQLNIDEELKQIHVEMVKERALALKNQEERLGAMIMALQMEKAREMTQIEEQQKAINHLKATLMDDLNERGILSTPECQQILEIHKQDSEALHHRLETQRAKQEKILRSKLQERIQQREHLLLAQHESEMKNLMVELGNKFAAKVRRVMLIHKHLVAMEKFRNRLDREVNQTLAETRRQFDMVKCRKVQEQELAFVAGLVRIGDFTQEELLDVLHMLFPGKTEEDIQEILSRITEGCPPADKDNKRMGRRNSMIVEKIYQTQFGNTSLSRSSSTRSSRGSSKQKKLSKTGSRLSMTNQGMGMSLGTIKEPDLAADYAGAYDQQNGALQDTALYEKHRKSNPDYSGRGKNKSRDVYKPSYDEGMDFVAMGVSMSRGDGGSGPGPAGRLPPLLDVDPSARKKKKKKGFLARHNAN